MLKNTAGQRVGGQVLATDGTAFTGAVTVYVTGDAGTQAIGSVGSGACTHEGNGYHTYAPSQAETNYDLCAFTFIGTGASPATVQKYTEKVDLGNIVLPAGAIPSLGITDNGVVQAGSTTTAVIIRAAASFPDGILAGKILSITSGTGAGQTAIITTNVNTTDTLTVPTLATAPDATSSYVIYTAPLGSSALPIPANLVQVLNDAQSATDFKDFVDAGYDPATNKVQGVVLTDTTTALTSLTTTTRAEPAAGAPAATITPAAKLDYLYAWLRNKKTVNVQSGMIECWDAAGTTVLFEMPYTDSGTSLTVSAAQGNT
jgi:hypothetical protein